jgi:hypothetical protein
MEARLYCGIFQSLVQHLDRKRWKRKDRLMLRDIAGVLQRIEAPGSFATRRTGQGR